MRKWQDLAAQDDPNSWNAVSGMWPTIRGTYETADISGVASTLSTLTSSYVAYAFQSGGLEYVAINQGTATGLYATSGTTLSGSTVGTSGVLRGAISMVRGSSGSPASVVVAMTGVTGVSTLYTISSIGGVASIAGSPSGRNILCRQSNVVLAFSTASATWNTSDVGDFTNWATLEASSGTFYDSNSTSAAVAFGNDVYVFNPDNILRMTYVGGSSIKWNVQSAWKNGGVPTGTPSQDWAVATRHGIAYYGGSGNVWLYDGVSEPRLLNPLTTIPVETISGVFTYDSAQDMLCIAPSQGSSASGTARVDSSTSTQTSLYYYYNFASQMWGSGFGNDGELQLGTGSAAVSGVVRGAYADRLISFNPNSSKPRFWMIPDTTTGTVKHNSPTSPTSSTACYLQTMKVGSNREKTLFDRVSVKGRRRTDLGSGSASLSFELFRELEDTSAQATRAVTESTSRKRFDLNGGAAVDNFGRFKVTWTGLDVEVEDFDIIAKKAGVE